MKLLHTSDWHVGKTIRGHSRGHEHQAVLDEIVALAGEHEVDAVIVAGDLYESAAPHPDAERLVYRTLLRLAETGAVVVVVAGNHDHARRLDAVAPVFGATGEIHVVARPAPADSGGVHHLTTRSGERAQIACLPFVSQRGIVRAADLFDRAAFENTQAYQERIAAMLAALCTDFDSESVNVVVAHAFVVGGQLGGGERSAHVIDDYAIPSQAFPITASYVALGHVHRAQKIAAGAPLHYCGSPLQLDFGERPESKQVNLVEASPGVPARVTALPLRSGRRLVTLRGRLHELAERHRSGDIDHDAWLRIELDEPGRAGLADEVREMFGERAVDVRSSGVAGSSPRRRQSRQGRSPHELFAEFMAERGVDDDRLGKRFADLLDAELSDDPADEPAGSDERAGNGASP